MEKPFFLGGGGGRADQNAGLVKFMPTNDKPRLSQNMPWTGRFYWLKFSCKITEVVKFEQQKKEKLYKEKLLWVHYTC
jgi:hypothetical protein